MQNSLVKKARQGCSAFACQVIREFAAPACFPSARHFQRHCTIRTAACNAPKHRLRTDFPSSLHCKGERQLGNLSTVTAESFQIGPGVTQDTVALAEKIATLDEGFVR